MVELEVLDEQTRVLARGDEILVKGIRDHPRVWNDQLDGLMFPLIHSVGVPRNSFRIAQDARQAELNLAERLPKRKRVPMGSLRAHTDLGAGNELGAARSAVSESVMDEGGRRGVQQGRMQRRQRKRRRRRPAGS